jgi:hypothetical protein
VTGAVEVRDRGSGGVALNQDLHSN